ncbi:hypothetical protein NBT05_10045 [Aquimarina sp. ERC-38]|uniref:hypothetical protein n=1 Tax=Aquimarina sp. ERC-38 TaxID=2949996 RepID=UPI00224846E5|nr:hypothetical protein [Aquimarina sp. ERC-38]UZO79311.1 hypothetical protein NBT05_10045 [Aquimarina sp. ERC-38]
MDLSIYLGLLTPEKIITGGIFYVVLLVTALYMVIKNENKIFVFLWILFILFLPILGSIIYIAKFFLDRNSNRGLANK